MKTFWILCILINQAVGQNSIPGAADPGKPDSETLSREGQMLSIRLTAHEPIRFYVVGKEEAQLDLSQLELMITRLKPAPRRTFHVSRVGNEFVMEESVPRPIELEVTAKTPKHTEKFHFKLIKVPPR